MKREKKDDVTAGLSKYGMLEEYDVNAIIEERNRAPGPNNWAEIGPGDFGPEHDYTVNLGSSISIIDPVSEAALQWCYRFLPEDCPRWGAKGFVIENRYLGPILEGMFEAGLLDRDQYMDNMHGNDRDAHAGENQ